MLNLRSILHSRIRANKMFFAYSRLIKHSTFLMFVLTTHGKSLIHFHNNSRYQKEICHAVTMPKAMETYQKSLPCIKYRIFFLFGILSIGIMAYRILVGSFSDFKSYHAFMNEPICHYSYIYGNNMTPHYMLYFKTTYYSFAYFIFTNSYS